MTEDPDVKFEHYANILGPKTAYFVKHNDKPMAEFSNIDEARAAIRTYIKVEGGLAAGTWEVVSCNGEAAEKYRKELE